MAFSIPASCCTFALGNSDAVTWWYNMSLSLSKNFSSFLKFISAILSTRFRPLVIGVDISEPLASSTNRRSCRPLAIRSRRTVIYIDSNRSASRFFTTCPCSGINSSMMIYSHSDMSKPLICAAFAKERMCPIGAP